MATHLTFGEAGNAVPFQGDGWSEPEIGITWSIGSESRLRLPVPPGDDDLLLEMRVEPMMAQDVPGQTLIVAANNLILGRAFVDNEAVLVVAVPRAICGEADALDIVFQHPDAKSPLAAGTGDDERVLAFAFQTVRLMPKPPEYADGQGIVTAEILQPPALDLTFGAEGDAAPYQRGGWAEPDAQFTWSVGPQSRLELPVPPGASDLLLDIHAAPFTAPDLPGQTLIVSANGNILRSTYMSGESVITVPVPSSAFANTAALYIALQFPHATSELKTGTGADSRDLGFAFHGVWLRQKPIRSAAPLPVAPAPAHGSSEGLDSPSSLRLTFGVDGDAGWHLGNGWSDPEVGLTWSVGAESQLVLPVPAGAQGDLLLEIDLEPCAEPVVPAQRLIVSVNRTRIADESVRIRTVLWWRIPHAAFAGEPLLEISIQQPNAISPASAGIGQDARELACAFRSLVLAPAPSRHPVQARTLAPLPASSLEALAEAARRGGLPLNDLAARFESLGHNCEFGLVQRRFGAEPNALLRFTSIPPVSLLAGLRRGFAGMAEPSNLEVFDLVTEADPVGEWTVRDTLYQTETHSFLTRDQAGPNLVLWQSQRLTADRYRDTADTLRQGDKIFVFQHRDVRSQAAVEPIAAALARLGPGTLLWVTVESGYPSGSVTLLRPGLLLGAIDRLAPERAVASADHIAWGSLLVNAYALWRGNTNRFDE